MPHSIHTRLECSRVSGLVRNCEYKYRPLSNFEFTRIQSQQDTQPLVEGGLRCRQANAAQRRLLRLLLKKRKSLGRDASPSRPRLHAGLALGEGVVVFRRFPSNVSSIDDARQKPAIAPTRFSFRAQRFAYFAHFQDRASQNLTGPFSGFRFHRGEGAPKRRLQCNAYFEKILSDRFNLSLRN